MTSTTTGYSAINTNEAKAYITEKSKYFIDYSIDKYQALKKYAEDGNWTWKVAGFIAGLLISVLSVLSLLSNFLGLSLLSVVLDVYLLAFGLIACVLEYKEKVLTSKYLNLLNREALFLSRPYGRAAFYLFVGILIACRGGLLNLIVGAYTSIVGIILFRASYIAVASFKSFRDSRLDTEKVTQKFREFDKDNNGTLDPTELAALVASLGTVLSLNELEAALVLIDRNGDGKITLEEFLTWYQGKEDFNFA